MQLMTDKGEMLPTDTWALAYWPDGSVKWKGIAGVIPKIRRNCYSKDRKKSKEKHLQGLPMIVAINYPYLLLKHLKVSA